MARATPNCHLIVSSATRPEITARQNIATKAAKVATGFDNVSDERFVALLSKKENRTRLKKAMTILNEADKVINREFERYFVHADSPKVLERLDTVAKLGRAAKLKESALAGIESRKQFRDEFARFAAMASILAYFDVLLMGKRAMADIASDQEDHNLFLLRIALERNAQRA